MRISLLLLKLKKDTITNNGANPKKNKLGLAIIYFY